ncbi:MAG: hypothetical protein HS117_15720 [Verrucomicrobiaceae bacterium]|jgi:hypothetical protein|nr:hypothetical protein [Verrucomicrobiaceae bacterium]
MKSALALLVLSVLTGCTSLPNPNLVSGKAGSEAVQLLEKSAAKAGRPWHRLERVEVAFSGRWTTIVQKLQPDLVDAGHRQSSREVYSPRSGRVEQTHTGPQGTKHVVRTPGTIEVRFNGQGTATETAEDAAALVADAYTMFVFGADYLLSRGSDWRLWLSMQRQEIDGDPCSLVTGTMKPGVGRSTQDKVIAWISQRDHRLRRVQFTLNGLESTAGADVDVTFDDFEAGPRGTEWPRHFLETVRRPLTVKAHEWRMTGLKVK